jgi:hypothetical protein
MGNSKERMWIFETSRDLTRQHWIGKSANLDVVFLERHGNGHVVMQFARLKLGRPFKHRVHNGIIEKMAWIQDTCKPIDVAKTQVPNVWTCHGGHNSIRIPRMILKKRDEIVTAVNCIVVHGHNHVRRTIRNVTRWKDFADGSKICSKAVYKQERKGFAEIDKNLFIIRFAPKGIWKVEDDTGHTRKTQIRKHIVQDSQTMGRNRKTQEDPKGKAESSVL